MIVLDTNVVSALMRKDPDGAVIAWIDAQPAESMWITSVTVFELHLGVNLLAAGRRRRNIEAALARVLEDDLQNRILDFDSIAAICAARIASERQRMGRPVDFRDTQIAGIAVARRASLATRNVRHFEDLVDLTIVDPWSDRR